MSRLTEVLPSWLRGAVETRSSQPRRPRRVILSCDTLEGRVTPSHFGGGVISAAAAHHARFGRGHHNSTGTTNTGGTTTTTATTTTTTTTNNTALQTALTTLRNDVNTILSASSVTVAQVNAINTAFHTLRTDGLVPTNPADLLTFQNTLVTTFASGTAVTGNSALLDQFKALFTASPTDQQTTDLTAAYDALAAAVTSSNITQANITTIDTDWAAVVAAGGASGPGAGCTTTSTTSTTTSTSTSTTTPTFPYFSLVVGQGPGLGGPHGPGGFGGPGGGRHGRH